jgi:hypothetical protein
MAASTIALPSAISFEASKCSQKLVTP